MKMKFACVLALLIVVAIKPIAAQQTNETKMKIFVDALMKKMTLQEKLGQLNLPGSGDIVTGQAQSSDIAGKIRAGKVGGLFNIKSVKLHMEYATYSAQC